MQIVTLNQPVPTFIAKTKDGELTLDQLRGKNVILYFYPKDNTPGCTLESKAFRDHYKDFQALNTEIIGLSKDSIASHCKFIDAQSLNFPLISDENEALCKLFDVIREKSMFGKKYMGIVRSTFFIDKNGVLQKEWRNVNAMGHVKDVLHYLREELVNP